MPRLSKIVLYAASGALGGSAVWAFILALQAAAGERLLTEIMLGALAGMFIGGFIWSHESISGRQFRTAVAHAGFGAIAGTLGGAAGAALGSTVFTALGRYVADLGGFKASLGVALAVALGWAILGAAVGASGGLMIRSRERALYGLTGGFIGGLTGGLMFEALSATSIWSALAGLALLGMSIGAFISLVEEVFVSAKVRVIKGRHVGREFPIVKAINTIGRDDRSDVCLSGAEGVGLAHAFIKRTNGSFIIERGQGGTTGVYVNNEKAERSRLSDGDVIRVGSILLMFRAVKKAAAAAVLFLLLGIHGAYAEGTLRTQITQFDLSDFPTVKTYVSVLDENGKPVRGLDARDVSLRENGVPAALKEVRAVGTPGQREPLTVALVLDKSGSMTGEKIARAKESVLRFLALMEKGDRATLFVFSDEVTETAPLTDDLERIKDPTRSIQAGGHTALYDAIARGVSSLQKIAGRRAVIVLTDGIANRGVVNIDQAIDTAVKDNVSVYAIGLGEDVRTARLERIAGETGGTYFFTPSADGLASIYETISRRIKNEYVITYDTQRRGEYLRRVSMYVNGKPATERAYFQPKSSLFGASGTAPRWAFLVSVISLIGLVGISLRKMERKYETGHLSVVKGKSSKKEIDIAATITLGRDERNTIGLFRDGGIEQYHAEVVKKNGHYLIRDKGSATGTFVNRKKISGLQALADGDVISIGDTRIVFSEGSQHTCPECGSAMRKGGKFCAKCGVKAA